MTGKKRGRPFKLTAAFGFLEPDGMYTVSAVLKIAVSNKVILEEDVVVNRSRFLSRLRRYTIQHGFPPEGDNFSPPKEKQRPAWSGRRWQESRHIVHGDLTIRYLDSPRDLKTILALPGVYGLAQFCRVTLFNSRKIHYRISKEQDPKTVMGIWRVEELELYVVDMPVFANWLRQNWDGVQ